MDRELIIRIIVPIGILIVVWLIVDKIFGISKGWKEDREKNARDESKLRQEQDEISRQRESGEKRTMPLSKIKGLADALYNAMKGAGTDYNRVMQVFSNLGNNTDFLLLQREFGIRDDENLNQWINDDLSSGQVSKLNNYLRTKKITYSF